MPGRTDLGGLLRQMRPTLDPERYVFATTRDGGLAARAPALARIEEAEGTTLILRPADAEAAGLAGEFPCRRITLAIHSSLDAVGFLAAILPELSARGIGVNPVAGFYHDHLFVPEDRAEDALRILVALGAQAGAP